MCDHVHPTAEPKGPNASILICVLIGRCETLPTAADAKPVNRILIQIKIGELYRYSARLLCSCQLTIEHASST